MKRIKETRGKGKGCLPLAAAGITAVCGFIALITVRKRRK